MKKLFQIFDTKTRQPVPGVYFENKEQAKQHRRELNGDPETQPLRYVVTSGPDHRNYARS